MKEGFIQESLGKIGKKEKGGETFMGICKMHSKSKDDSLKHRRVDIKTYPRN